MKTQSIDTSPDAERVLVEMIRKAPVTRRFGYVQSWSSSLIEGGRMDVRRLYPLVSEQEVSFLYAERQYGKNVVDELRRVLHERKLQPSSPPDFWTALLPLIDAFERLHIPYALGGSLASSLYGMQRAALQLDFLAAFDSWQKDLFLNQLASSYFFHANDGQVTPGQEQAFTLFHLESFLKVSISLPQARAFNRGIFERAHSLTLIEGSRVVATLSPEDVIALQLEQFKRSNERADDSWYDLLGVLKVQGNALDWEYLERWAVALGVRDLLEHALMEAGLQQP